MAAATGQVLVWFGHETGHDAKPLANFFGTGFKQNSTVGLLQRLAETNGRFVHARPGFSVQSFYGHFESQHVVHDGVEKFSVVVGAQKRITKHAGRERLRPHAFFVGPALGCFQKVVPLKFHAGHDFETHLFGTFQHFF